MGAPPIVLDASFLIAFHNARDVHHPEAARVMERFHAGEWGGGALLEYVFLEVVTVLRLRLGLAAADRVGRILLGARELELIPCSDLFHDAWEAFRRQPRDELSFVDAAIWTVARRHPPGFVATFDGGFHGLEGVAAVPGGGAGSG